MRFFFFCLLTGILLSSNSPPVSTQLEPCRVAPYVNMPSMRASSITPVTTASHQYSSGAAVAAAFSAFDPALLSVAHQVSSFSLFGFFHFSLSFTVDEIKFHLTFNLSVCGCNEWK